MSGTTMTRTISKLREVLAEVANVSSWTLLINPTHWLWSVDKNPTKKWRPSKMHTSPDRQTEWLTPEQAVDVIMSLADQGFSPTGDIGEKLKLIMAVKTDRGVIFCTTGGESFPLKNGADLLDLDPKNRYFEVDPLFLTCKDVYGKTMEPTEKAKREISIARATLKIEAHGLFRDTIIKHGMTMDEVWAILSALNKKYVDDANWSLSKSCKSVISERMNENIKKNRGRFFGLDSTNTFTDDQLTAEWNVVTDLYTSAAIQASGLLKMPSGDKYLYLCTDVFKRPLIFTRHFFERYSQRNGIATEDFDMSLEICLREIAQSLTTTLYFDKVRNRSGVFMPLQGGVGLGSSVEYEDRTVVMIKTFVPRPMLATKQREVFDEMIKLNKK